MLVVIVKGDGWRELFALYLRQHLVVPSVTPRMLFAVRVSERGRHLLGPMVLKDLVGGRHHKAEALLLEDVNQRFAADGLVTVDEPFALVLRIRKGHAKSFDGWALLQMNLEPGHLLVGVGQPHQHVLVELLDGGDRI